MSGETGERHQIQAQGILSSTAEGVAERPGQCGGIDLPDGGDVPGHLLFEPVSENLAIAAVLMDPQEVADDLAEIQLLRLLHLLLRHPQVHSFARPVQLLAAGAADPPCCRERPGMFVIGELVQDA